MISFTDITESILYIRNKNKQKVNSERILIQLKKKEQCEDLSLCTLEKGIATFIETGMLHINAPTKEEPVIVNKESEEI